MIGIGQVRPKDLFLWCMGLGLDYNICKAEANELEGQGLRVEILKVQVQAYSPE